MSKTDDGDILLSEWIGTVTSALSFWAALDLRLDFDFDFVDASPSSLLPTAFDDNLEDFVVVVVVDDDWVLSHRFDSPPFRSRDDDFESDLDECDLLFVACELFDDVDLDDLLRSADVFDEVSCLFLLECDDDDRDVDFELLFLCRSSRDLDFSGLLVAVRFRSVSSSVTAFFSVSSSVAFTTTFSVDVATSSPLVDRRILVGTYVGVASTTFVDGSESIISVK